ncbi:hypothetical protein GCM10027296_38990 [Chitinimonas naiadis]
MGVTSVNEMIAFAPTTNGNVWRMRTWRDTGPVITIRRRSLVAITITVLFHLMLLLTIFRVTQKMGEQPHKGRPSPVYLYLNPADALKMVQVDEAPKPSKAKPEPKPQPEVERPRAITLPRHPKPREEPTPPAPSPMPAPELESTPPPQQAATPPATDLMAYVNAARERRKAQEAQNGGAPAPTADEIRDANIRRNLQPPGTNGIFQILSKSLHTATFSFRGWTTSSANSRREVIEVSVGMNDDLDRAIVRKMIELIRRYYTGEFNWESQRLRRTVVLSARPQDTAQLEEFMMMEFFGPGVR